jgi:nucleoside-diphosphate-sugar epimerase
LTGNTILISGIKGFLARNLADLLKQDYVIYGIGKQEELIEGIKIFSSDDIKNININPDFVILCHAAVASGNYTPSEDALNDVNVVLTKSIVNKFQNAHFIYISTVSVYDASISLIQENSAIKPETAYAKSKWMAENIVHELKNASIFRLSSLFGIGMKENTIIPNYVNQAIKDNLIEVWGNGNRLQNFLFVEDACKFIQLAIQNFELVKNKILLAVGSTEYSNLELAKIISKYTNAEIKFVKEDLSKSFIYNNNYTCNLLQWKPVNGFEMQIQKYIQWRKEQY